MTKRTFSRRSFLEGLGVAAAAGAATTGLLPFLPTPEKAHADGHFPQRLLIFHTPNGYPRVDRWRPSGSETDFTLAPCLDPLERHKDKLIIVDGVDNTAAYHNGFNIHYGTACLWTGVKYRVTNGTDHLGHAMGPSVDQIVADRIGGETTYKSLALGINTRGNRILHGRPFSAGVNETVFDEPSPQRVFDRVFGDFMADPRELEDLRARRQSVLDRVSSELSSIQSQLGAGDRARMESHLEGIRALERRLASDTAVTCVPPDRPGSIGGSYSGSADVPRITDLQVGNIAAIFACDVTRVMTVTWGQDGHTGRPGYLGWTDEDIHTTSHKTDSRSIDRFQRLNRFWAESFGQMLDALDAVPEGDGTMLDNTLCVWGMPESLGDPHSSRNVPMILAQGRNCRWPTGRWLRYGSFSDSSSANREHGGEPMNKLLVSICHGMGLEDIDTVGESLWGRGPLDALG